MPSQPLPTCTTARAPQILCLAGDRQPKLALGQVRDAAHEGIDVSKVVIYTTKICPYCVQAKSLLRRKGVGFSEIDVTNDAEKRTWLVGATGRRTVPQIFIDNQPIGGFDALSALDRTGDLDRMLAPRTYPA